MTARRYPDGSRATFTYDATGNRTLMANATGRYSFSYNGNGQTTVSGNPGSKTITYTYDAVGNRAGMDAPDAGRFTYIYDATNQITLLHNAFDERTTFAYDDTGRRTLKKQANGTRTSYTYDAAGNLTNLHNLKSDNSVISSFDYRYNDISDRVAVGEAGGDRVTWTYDNASQLTSEHRSGVNTYRNTFVYDAVGNRLVLNEDGTRTTTSYDAASQIDVSEAAAGRTTYTFDADGNQQIVEQPSSDRTTNVWDYENRLTNTVLPNAARCTLSYQPDNLRVTSDDGTSSKTWLWENQNYLSQTAGGVLVFTNTPERYGELVSQHDGTDTSWYHFNARGDTRELSDISEVVTDTKLYDAWGNVLNSTGNSEMPFQFVGLLGYFTDRTGDLRYVRERWYLASDSRWMSEDVFRTSEDGPNLYTYGRNNPIRRLDPSGRATLIIKPQEGAAGHPYSYQTLPIGWAGLTGCSFLIKCFCDWTIKVRAQSLYPLGPMVYSIACGYEESCTIWQTTSIRLDPKQIDGVNDTEEGVYGHEQRHVQNCQAKAKALAKTAVSKLHRTKAACVVSAAATMKRTTKAWQVWDAREELHLNPESPKGNDYEPIGKMPKNPK